MSQIIRWTVAEIDEPVNRWQLLRAFAPPDPVDFFVHGKMLLRKARDLKGAHFLYIGPPLFYENLGEPVPLKHLITIDPNQFVFYQRNDIQKQ